MVKEHELNAYLESIPPLPEPLKASLLALEAGDLPLAARPASKDPALSFYFRQILQKPFFGLAHNVTDMVQLFGALGIIRIQQLMQSYMLTLLAPKKWQFFALDEERFGLLQMECLEGMDRLLLGLGSEDHDAALAAIMLPATVVVCERLFLAHKQEVALLQEVRPLSFDDLLGRLGGVGLMELAIIIGKKWQIPDRTLRILSLASAQLPKNAPEEQELFFARHVHLLFFWILSKKPFMAAGLNSLITLEPSFVAPILERFLEIMEPGA